MVELKKIETKFTASRLFPTTDMISCQDTLRPVVHYVLRKEPNCYRKSVQ